MCFMDKLRKLIVFCNVNICLTVFLFLAATEKLWKTLVFEFIITNAMSYCFEIDGSVYCTYTYLSLLFIHICPVDYNSLLFAICGQKFLNNIHFRDNDSLDQ